MSDFRSYNVKIDLQSYLKTSRFSLGSKRRVFHSGTETLFSYCFIRSHFTSDNKVWSGTSALELAAYCGVAKNDVSGSNVEHKANFGIEQHR